MIKIKENRNGFFWEIQRTLGWEFSRYVLSHPKVEDKIPNGAEVVFQIKGNAEFNRWARTISRSNHESGRPIVVVKVEGLTPPPPMASRLINPRLALLKKI